MINNNCQCNEASNEQVLCDQLYMCSFTTTSMQTTFKCIQRVPQGQSSQSSQCLVRQNNILLKCQAVSLRRKWKVVVLVGQHREEGVLFFSFNVTQAWHIFTRVTCQKNINPGNFLSHPYISSQRLSKRHRRIPSMLLQRQISIYWSAWMEQFKQCE